MKQSDLKKKPTHNIMNSKIPWISSAKNLYVHKTSPRFFLVLKRCGKVSYQLHQYALGVDLLMTIELLFWLQPGTAEDRIWP